MNIREETTKYTLLKSRSYNRISREVILLEVFVGDLISTKDMVKL